MAAGRLGSDHAREMVAFLGEQLPKEGSIIAPPWQAFVVLPLLPWHMETLPVCHGTSSLLRSLEGGSKAWDHSTNEAQQALPERAFKGQTRVLCCTTSGSVGVTYAL